MTQHDQPSLSGSNGRVLQLATVQAIAAVHSTATFIRMALGARDE